MATITLFDGTFNIPDTYSGQVALSEEAYDLMLDQTGGFHITITGDNLTSEDPKFEPDHIDWSYSGESDNDTALTFQDQEDDNYVTFNWVRSSANWSVTIETPAGRLAGDFTATVTYEGSEPGPEPGPEPEPQEMSPTSELAGWLHAMATQDVTGMKPSNRQEGWFYKAAGGDITIIPQSNEEYYWNEFAEAVSSGSGGDVSWVDIVPETVLGEADWTESVSDEDYEYTCVVSTDESPLDAFLVLEATGDSNVSRKMVLVPDDASPDVSIRKLDAETSEYIRIFNPTSSSLTLTLYAGDSRQLSGSDLNVTVSLKKLVY